MNQIFLKFQNIYIRKLYPFGVDKLQIRFLLFIYSMLTLLDGGDKTMKSTGAHPSVKEILE
jgi:hypothetical protein